MIDPINEHMNDVFEKREKDLIKESRASKQIKRNLESEKEMTSNINNDGSGFSPIMGEKEFFDVMKTNNRHLTMEERYLIAEIINAFTERRKQDEAEGAI